MAITANSSSSSEIEDNIVALRATSTGNRWYTGSPEQVGSVKVAFIVAMFGLTVVESKRACFR